MYFITGTVELVSQSEGVCQPSKCILICDWASLWRLHVSKEMHLTAGSYRTLFLVFYPFPTPLPRHSLLIYHSISFIVSFKLQVCGDVMLDFPLSIPLPGVYDHHKVCFTHAATWPRTYYFLIIPSVHIFLALQCSMSLFKRSLHAGDVSVWFICTFIDIFQVFVKRTLTQKVNGESHNAISDFSELLYLEERNKPIALQYYVRLYNSIAQIDCQFIGSQ